MIAFYVSGHGFGHASRDIEVLNELGRSGRRSASSLRTSAPRWIFDLTLKRPVDWRPRESDTGVVQIDSLQPRRGGDDSPGRRHSIATSTRTPPSEAEWLREEGDHARRR